MIVVAPKHQPPSPLGGGRGNARAQRVKLLSYVAILPWVRVPDLASHLLNRIAGRLSQDWQAKYGHPIHLLESFVQADRFLGRCYRAAGWIALGSTTGRGRNAPGPAPQGPVKDIYIRALNPDWARRLCP
jgi:Druantia protein DruA